MPSATTHVKDDALIPRLLQPSHKVNPLSSLWLAFVVSFATNTISQLADISFFTTKIYVFNI